MAKLIPISKHHAFGYQTHGRWMSDDSSCSQSVETLLQIVERESKQVSPRTAANYLTAARSLLMYCKKADLPLCRMTEKLMAHYQQWLYQRGICMNTVSCYMRSLRSIYRKAQQGKRQRRNPFEDVFTGREKTVKRALSVPDLNKIQRLEIHRRSPLSMARDMFLFSIYGMGIPFVDLINLQHSNIQGETIVYRRQKTGRKVCITLEPCMLDILQKYEGKSSKYLFPIQRMQKGGDRRPLEYRTLLGYYNTQLRQIGMRAKIRQPLSSYVARHTWASVAFQNNVNLNVISQAMGHANPNTTMVYIQGINSCKIAEENKKLLRHLTPPRLSRRRR